MQFQRTKAAAGSEQFLDMLFEEVQQQIDELPLAHLCIRGGWPLNVKLGTISILSDSPAQLQALLFISFSETGAGCCDDSSQFAFERSGQINLHLDKQTWQAEFSQQEEEANS